MSEVDKEQVKAEFEAAFNEISGGDDKITNDDLKAALEKAGIEADDDQIAAIIEAADKDGTGYIGFEDFVEVICTAQFTKLRVAALLKIFFKAVDPDGTGYVSAEQMQEAAAKYDLASKVPQETIDEIQGALANAEGQISYEEFIQKLKEKIEEQMG